MQPTIARDNLYESAFALMASPAQYTAPGSATPVATRAVVKRGMVPVGDFAQASQPTILLNLPVADVPKPAIGATVVVENQGTFTVERRQSDNGYKVTVSAREVTP